MEPVCRDIPAQLGQKLGIVANYRTVDFALNQKRLDAFDFDTTIIRLPDIQIPGTEQETRFGSKSADQQGSDNLWGLKSPAVDQIVHALIGAQTREQLVDATHALDRVLMHGYYVIPAVVLGVTQDRVQEHAGLSCHLALYYTADDLDHIDLVVQARNATRHSIALPRYRT